MRARCTIHITQDYKINIFREKYLTVFAAKLG